jgi:hypothetical protein
VLEAARFRFAHPLCISAIASPAARHSCSTPTVIPSFASTRETFAVVQAQRSRPQLLDIAFVTVAFSKTKKPQQSSAEASYRTIQNHLFMQARHMHPSIVVAADRGCDRCRSRDKTTCMCAALCRPLPLLISPTHLLPLSRTWKRRRLSTCSNL